ncbi:MAG TPA: tetratricopeptide repeat protein [Pirellulales bacterium]|jgi:serine/threonine protein kinase|nr:tetratricopeptide repeat protein [Pirellulales bacterium]
MSVSPSSLPETKADPPYSAVGRDNRREPIRDVCSNEILAATLQRMADEWRLRRGRSAEQWLAENPELNADAESAVRIVYEEFCLREERGETIESTELYRRFPQWHDALAVVLDCHRLLHNVHQPPQFPEAGDCLGEFRLFRELGRGGLGRVFLATQPSLSDRQLVVKLTARGGQEHLSLARLQHTNIVPLYLVQDFPEENLRALCMPYLGGATWAAVLRGIQGCRFSDHSGRQIVEQLTEAQCQDSTPLGATGPAISYLARSTYVDAVCWIGACLADALCYAHQRGLVHLDVKPSNVLLAGDGQPMLLDFHLACETRRFRDKTIDRLGGTPGYMSPEQCSATEAVRRGAAIPQPLDASSDVYSLGVLLYESLAGKLPAAEALDSRRELRAANPHVSRGLEDILHKCLAHDPAARYRDAGQLAADLRRHLASLPLCGVANRSLAERLQKWRRRRPHAMPMLAIGLAAAVVMCTAGGLYYRDRIRGAEASLVASQRELANKEFAPSIEHARLAWGALLWFPWEVELKNKIQAQIGAARRSQAITSLHEFVDKLRFLDLQQVSDRNLAHIGAGCHEIWQARTTLAAPATGETGDHRDARLDEPLRRDLLDLAVFSSRIDLQLSRPATASDARRQARQMLDEARQLCGSSLLLDLEEREISTDAQHSAAEIRTDALPTAGNAWEHYAIGRWLMRHGSPAEAERQFEAAVALQPDEFWAYYQQTRCQVELGQIEQALASAAVCVALAPQHAECFYNRALCHESLGHEQDALADYSRALELDPTLAPAALARGILLAHLHRFTEATTDFDSALAHGSRPSEVYYQTARMHLAQHETAAAIHWLRKSLSEDPADPAALALQEELASTARH